jgi:hypothetical protein
MMRMNPRRFLSLAGPLLILLGILGLTGVLGRISSVSFFHPPVWINWVHLGLGTVIVIVARRGSARLQAGFTATAMVLGLALGMTGLLFGRYLASRYRILELADPTDHVAHLLIGIFAAWGWRNRIKN